jgi:homocysteine S-methyltransferase
MIGQESFARRIAQHRAVVIDGGLATQLEAQGCDIDNPLWSASMIESNPQAIVDAHRAYLDAGAEIIITASYQTTAADLVARSVELAIQSRDEYSRDNPNQDRLPLIAGSAGPYGAVMGDGSEYTGDYDVGIEELRDFHRSRLEILDDSGADLIACETIPSFDEARVLCELLEDVRHAAWISFSCRDESRISDGTPIADAAALFRDHPRVLAVGINCTRPQFVAPLIGHLREAIPEKAIVVYPNSGEDYDAGSKTWSGTVTALDWAKAARQWADAGATIIGGCCRTGPEHIRAISEQAYSQADWDSTERR